ncbi:MAG: 7-cyano-7-deazaguanine synthase QueC [Candidatus Omnitrophica bacterium]|nr:7-cyano-7-deazaguanine synthase QueC [Candidatus Omnitrophota bacterium]
MKRAVCLLSGGMDSAVAAAVAKAEGYSLYGLTFNYGQKNRREIVSARRIATWLKFKEHWIIRVYLLPESSSLTNPEKKIPTRITKFIPSTYVPGRNTLFISYGLAYAEALNAETIFIGINSIDYSGYPDCRPKYIRQFQKLINLALKKTISGKKLVLRAPLLHLSKDQIIKKGLELGLDFSLTWSCYRSGEKPCGVCPACQLRLEGFRKAGLVDPLVNQTEERET